MPAAVIPALIMGGASIGSSIIGGQAAKSAAKAASQRSPEELALVNQQTSLAKQQQGQSAELFGQGMPAVQSTLRYYQGLLSGGKGARVAATSPEAESVGEAYQGADAALKRGNVRGGELVQQLAENQRAKAGQIARLVTGARPGAASALGSLGSGLVGAGQQGAAGAANTTAGLINNSTQNRQMGNYLGAQAGGALTGNLGKLFANLASNTGWFKGGGGGGGGANPLSTWSAAPVGTTMSTPLASPIMPTGAEDDF